MSVPKLLPYQVGWVRDSAGLKVCEKSRRIGLSWAEAYDAVLHAGAGRGNVYYQSYAQDMTRGFITDCADWARQLNVAAEAVGETLIDLNGDQVPAFRLPLASGKEVVAMTSAPRAFRSKGRPGDRAVVDEAAFVDDLAEVLKAALAFRVWGGSVHVISTHNGESSPFAALVRDVREGVVPGSLHTIPLRAALTDGLYRRVCDVQGIRWSASAEARWEAGLRAEYGERAAEELDCIPSAGGGSWLPWALIRAAEDASAGKPDGYAGGPTYIGIDIARRRDLWVAVVIEVVGDVRWVRELVTRRKIPFAEQHAIVDDLVDHYQPVRMAADQTGMGEEFVERLQERHGVHRVEGVLFNGPRRLDLATALLESLEDRCLRTPPDAELRRDLHAIRAETSPTGAPRLIAARAGTDGHADRFWALALGVSAAAGGHDAFEYESAGERPSAAGLNAWVGGEPAGASPFAGYI